MRGLSLIETKRKFIREQVKRYIKEGWSFDRDVANDINMLSDSDVDRLRKGGKWEILNELSYGYRVTDRKGRPYDVDAQDVKKVMQNMQKERGLKAAMGLDTTGIRFNPSTYEGFKKLEKSSKKQASPNYQSQRVQTWFNNWITGMQNSAKSGVYSAGSAASINNVIAKAQKLGPLGAYQAFKNSGATDVDEMYYPSQLGVYIGGKASVLKKIENALDAWGA